MTPQCRSPLHNGGMHESVLAPTLPLEWLPPTDDEPYGAVPADQLTVSTDGPLTGGSDEPFGDPVEEGVARRPVALVLRLWSARAPAGARRPPRTGRRVASWSSCRPM